MTRDRSTARSYGRTLQAVHLLQEAIPAALSGDDILSLLNVNEVTTDAQPKKVTISGLAVAAASFVVSASGSARGPEGSIQFNKEGVLNGSSELIYTGSGIYASGVTSTSYTTNLNSIKSVVTSGYTLQESDNGRTVLFTNANRTTVQVPAGLTPGFNCTLIQTTVSGQVALTSGTGVALNSAYSALKTTTRYSVAGVIGVNTETYVVTGDITI